MFAFMMIVVAINNRLHVFLSPDRSGLFDRVEPSGSIASKGTVRSGRSGRFGRVERGGSIRSNKSGEARATLFDHRTVVVVVIASTHYQRNAIRQRTRLLEQGAVGAEPGFNRKPVFAGGQVGGQGEHQAARVVDTQDGDGGCHRLVGQVDQGELAHAGVVGIDTAYLRAGDVEHAARGDGAVGLAGGHVFYQADVGGFSPRPALLC